ncbi:hypothetical protein [Novosphingobium subterraneum]|uniref:hypothetical protein n=1 Tax=Novosphingobium subterraneum TaxID=48936 RepID=UPI0012DFF5BF|nr:hypothetical protein [Novosphingobium subterraneum]
MDISKTNPCASRTDRAPLFQKRLAGEVRSQGASNGSFPQSPDIDRRQMKTGLIPGLLCQVATSSQLLVAIGRHMGDWQKVPQDENGKG